MHGKPEWSTGAQSSGRLSKGFDHTINLVNGRLETASNPRSLKNPAQEVIMESAQQHAVTSEGGRTPELSTAELIEGITKLIDSLKDIRLENLIKELTESDVKHLTSRVLSARSFADEIFHFPGFSASPAWDMVLDLYLRDGAQRRTSVTDACLGARCPPTTGLRWLRVLEDMGLIARAADPNDRRRTYISLTNDGRTRTAKAIRAYATI